MSKIEIVQKFDNGQLDDVKVKVNNENVIKNGKLEFKKPKIVKNLKEEKGLMMTDESNKSENKDYEVITSNRNKPQKNSNNRNELNPPT